jgi:hypothetical protein
VQPVALAPREVTDSLLLIRASEVEAGEIRPGVDLLLADHDLLQAARDLVPDRLLAIERARLVRVGELHRLADLERAGIGPLRPVDHPKKRCLPRSIRTNHADDAATRK